MDIITKWAKEQMENPEIILNVIEADKIEAKIRMKRKTLIEKLKNTDRITPDLIDMFEAEEISIEKKDLIKLMEKK